MLGIRFFVSLRRPLGWTSRLRFFHNSLVGILGARYNRNLEQGSVDKNPYIPRLVESLCLKVRE